MNETQRCIDCVACAVYGNAYFCYELARALHPFRAGMENDCPNFERAEHECRLEEENTYESAETYHNH